MTWYSLLKVNQRFGGTYRLHLQGRKISRALLATCFHAGFLLCSFYDLEDGGDMFLRNVGWLSTDYMSLYPKRWYSSYLTYCLLGCDTVQSSKQVPTFWRCLLPPCLLLLPWRWRVNSSEAMLLTRLHSVTSQKTVILIFNVGWFLMPDFEN
jgi:hypothetical protein